MNIGDIKTKKKKSSYDSRADFLIVITGRITYASILLLSADTLAFFIIDITSGVTMSAKIVSITNTAINSIKVNTFFFRLHLLSYILSLSKYKKNATFCCTFY